MGKPKKQRKGRNNDSDDDTIADLGDEVDSSLNSNAVAKKGGTSMVSAFSLLDVEEPEEESDNETEFPTNAQQIKNKRDHDKPNKQKKGKQRKKHHEDEDLDALLAEIENPQNKEKKGKPIESVSQTETLLQQVEIDEENIIAAKMAEVKIATAEDLYPDSEEETKKCKPREEADNSEKLREEGIVGESTVKTAAQKKKEKKEREKKARQENVKKEKAASKLDVKDTALGATSTDTVRDDVKETAEASVSKENDECSDDETKTKKDKKKKKDKAEKDKDKKKKPASAQLKAMQEALQKIKEEEKRLKQEEEDRIKREEDAIRLKEEKKQLEEEKRERKKEKEKERKEKLRKEGKLLTEKQKQDQRRAQQMLEAMRGQGIEIPQKDQVKDRKPVRYGTRKRSKKTEESEDLSKDTPQMQLDDLPKDNKDIEAESCQDEEHVHTVDSDKNWDSGSDDEEPSNTNTQVEQGTVIKQNTEKAKEDEIESEEETESEESSYESEDDDLSPIDRARLNIQKQRNAYERKRNTDVLRAPVVCVLGHVDTGKTKILDKLRRTNVQDGEAGGITQQIGATNVPIEAIKEQTRMCKDFQKFDLKLPGLLIIDTPGHESFSNLRSRGSSLCDIAILVIDIMHALEPQTIESIQLLRQRKTPFVVALNKIDRLFQWKSNPNSNVKNVIEKQQQNTKLEFDERLQEVIVQLAEQGLNAALFSENTNIREYVSLVPTSAHSGDGIGNLIALVCELTQNLLAKRISYSEEIQATVMEVKALPGLGTTVDVILVNGVIREGDTIVLPGTEGPIVTQIRACLMPQPMKELRVKNQYVKHKEVMGAQGVKLLAKDTEKVLAGLPMYVAHNADEVEYYKEELKESLKAVLNSIKLSERGVYVQSSTLGSLEALLEFLKTSNIPYAGINIGPVHKKDIIKASTMLEHDSQYAVLLAFDVKVEREAQEYASNIGVTIFSADIIYHLFDQFIKYQDDLKARRKAEFKHVAVFPCKIRILPNCIFNSRDPIVVGVSVEAGVMKQGTPLCVPSKEFIDIGRVSSIEVNHKQVEQAKKGMEVCIKIDNTSGDAPKLYGRHFDHTDMLVSKISRESIDALKGYFRDEMTKTDWQLVMELKKIFEIL